MSQSMVNFRMDTNLKNQMDELCKELGMTMTTAFTIFASKMTRERRIPFDISIDPFYEETNLRYLEKVTAEIDSGKVILQEHEMTEV